MNEHSFCIGSIVCFVQMSLSLQKKNDTITRSFSDECPVFRAILFSEMIKDTFAISSRSTLDTVRKKSIRQTTFSRRCYRIGFLGFMVRLNLPRVFSILFTHIVLLSMLTTIPCTDTGSSAGAMRKFSQTV